MSKKLLKKGLEKLVGLKISRAELNGGVLRLDFGKFVQPDFLAPGTIWPIEMCPGEIELAFYNSCNLFNPKYPTIGKLNEKELEDFCKEYTDEVITKSSLTLIIHYT